MGHVHSVRFFFFFFGVAESIFCWKIMAACFCFAFQTDLVQFLVAWLFTERRSNCFAFDPGQLLVGSLCLRLNGKTSLRWLHAGPSPLKMCSESQLFAGSLCLLADGKNKQRFCRRALQKALHPPGIELGSRRWQRPILPLNQGCRSTKANIQNSQT